MRVTINRPNRGQQHVSHYATFDVRRQWNKSSFRGDRADQDGFVAADDCDDNNPNVYPNADRVR